MEPDTITISRDQLASALRQWDNDAKENAWPDRSDDDRHRDNADYLFGLLQTA